MHARTAVALLHDVREFVRDQVATARARRRPRAGTEHDVAAVGVGARLHVARSAFGHAAGVHAHLAEILAEARLEESAQVRRQRRAAIASDARSGVRILCA